MTVRFNIIEAKENAEKLIEALEKVVKREGKNSLANKVIDAAKAFIKCHIDNPAIYRRFDQLQSTLREVEDELRK